MTGIKYYPSRKQDKAQVVKSATANVSLALNDSGSLYYSNTASDITISITEANSLSFPIGAQIDFIRGNSGNVTINTTIANATVSSANSANKIRLQWGACSLIKTQSNAWIIIGDITT